MSFKKSTCTFAPQMCSEHNNNYKKSIVKKLYLLEHKIWIRKLIECHSDMKEKNILN